MREQTYTTAEVAEWLRCSTRKVRTVAADLGVGIDLGGKAGFRYTQTDITSIEASMRPDAPVAQRRRRRRAA